MNQNKTNQILKIVLQFRLHPLYTQQPISKREEGMAWNEYREKKKIKSLKPEQEYPYKNHQKCNMHVANFDS